MNVIETEIKGVFIIDPPLSEDARGFYARTYCKNTFSKLGIELEVTQCGIAQNAKKGTLRGLHFQLYPHAETKLVQCIKGALYDVVVDLRSESPTYKRWVSVNLNAQDKRQVFIPPYCAHGYQTLEDDTEVLYQMSSSYQPAYAAGVRWDDPDLGIIWPCEISQISTKDLNLPFLRALRTTSFPENIESRDD